MGIKKTGKKLMRLGKKASRRLGKDGRALVQNVLQAAIGTLQAEIKKRAKPSKKASGGRSGARPQESASKAAPEAQA